MWPRIWFGDTWKMIMWNDNNHEVETAEIIVWNSFKNGNFKFKF